MNGFPVLRTLRWAFFALLLGTALSANSAEDKPNGILFAVRDYMDSGAVVSGTGKDEGIKTLIEPFAYVTDGKLSKLPNETDPDGISDKDLDQLSKDYYSGHHKYTLYIGGKAGGSIEVTRTAFDIQCVSLAAEAQASPAGAISGMNMGLASNVDFKNLDYTRRVPTEKEKATILKFADGLYSDNKVPASVAARAKVSNITAFAGKSGTMLIGSLYAEETVTLPTYDENGHPTPQTYQADNVHAVFVVAEKTGDGPYKATYTWFHTGSDSSLETRDLVDLLDIDGDGTPEIVIESNGYEDVVYQVYKKQNGTWVEFFENSGGGC